ncbi:MAG: TlpA disulfide reductase family protein [Actinomycetota bacterium]|nr:TlpA disulfide reductase family protein [Actinomycetota bacterium]
MTRSSNKQRRDQRRQEAEDKRKADARKSTIRNVGIAGGIGLALIGLLVVLWPEPSVGNTTATAWDLPQLDGDGRVAIADFRGTPTVAAFFASWCEVCEHEIPDYLAVSQQVGDQVHFVGIDTQDNGSGLGDAERWGIAGVWPIARDIGGSNGSGLSSGTFGARGSPMTVFYDEDGTVVHVQQGGLSAQQLIDALDQLFGVQV